jgi:hypothetical protein
MLNLHKGTSKNLDFLFSGKKGEFDKGNIFNIFGQLAKGDRRRHGAKRRFLEVPIILRYEVEENRMTLGEAPCHVDAAVSRRV